MASLVRPLQQRLARLVSSRPQPTPDQAPVILCWAARATQACPHGSWHIAPLAACVACTGVAAAAILHLDAARPLRQGPTHVRAGRWLDQLVVSTGADGVSQVQPSTPEQYVSNYLPLWAGLSDGDAQMASTVLDSFLGSGGSSWRTRCCCCCCEYRPLWAGLADGDAQMASTLLDSFLSSSGSSCCCCCC